MNQKLTCKKCGKETEVQLRHDGKTDWQVFNCQLCGALHVEESYFKAPGSPAEFRFRLADES
ncbi:hypothetical protein [Pseudomonas vranovensis]|uniref:hypothetical protein n=1 Tax=Pseudomonas vranovensis TaxID=321661 RepID=UPI0009FE1AC8|nr:hypothetical protein [Pseudomonas vranovensis]